jgi:hypothetical protein
MKNVGSLSIYKGNIGEVQVKLWDALPTCDSSCELWEEKCPYDKTKKICDLRKNYVENVFTSLNKAVDERDEVTMHRLGFLLMPLYTSLISIKMEIHAKNGNIRGMKGSVDPIYRELRETIRMIDLMLKDLGINKNKDEEGKKRRDLINGNAEYYDDLLNEGMLPT